MSRTQHIAQRIVALLRTRNTAYCEGCLIERLQVASRAAMKATLETDWFTIRIGICPDCKLRKQVIAARASAGKVAA